jgi:hypothetical protein
VLVAGFDDLIALTEQADMAIRATGPPRETNGQGPHIDASGEICSTLGGANDAQFEVPPGCGVR